MSAKQTRCFLRKTEITLLDGNVYTFRALPLNRRTMPIVEAMVDASASEASKLRAAIDAITLSLSYDQDEATVDYVMENGLVPIASKGSEAELTKRVMEALVAGMTG